MTLLEQCTSLLQQGGWVLAVIIALSLFAWCLLTIKWWQLVGSPAPRREWIEHAIKAVESGQSAKVRSLADAQPGPLSRLLSLALQQCSQETGASGSAIDPAVAAECTDLRRHLNTLAVLGAIAPLLGLLGTVLGMLYTFEAIPALGLGNIDGMAGSIRKALLTTQAGLLVALPIWLLRTWLQSKAEQRVALTELFAKRLQATFDQGTVESK